MISLILAEKIFSLFLIMFMGYAVVHWGLLHAEDSKTLSLISLYLISPCVIISAFQVQYTPDVLPGKDWRSWRRFSGLAIFTGKSSGKMWTWNSSATDMDTMRRRTR